MANIKIDEQLFVELYKYFVFGSDIDDRTYAFIKNSLEAKMESLLARKDYSEHRGLL